jgi:hypothetical protein
MTSHRVLLFQPTPKLPVASGISWPVSDVAFITPGDIRRHSVPSMRLRRHLALRDDPGHLVVAAPHEAPDLQFHEKPPKLGILDLESDVFVLERIHPFDFVDCDASVRLQPIGDGLLVSGITLAVDAAKCSRYNGEQNQELHWSESELNRLLPVGKRTTVTVSSWPGV